MKKAKYSAIVIKRETVYLSSETGEVVTPTEQERLIDSIWADSRRFIYTDIFTKIGIATGQKISDLELNIWDVARKANVGYDFEIFRIR